MFIGYEMGIFYNFCVVVVQLFDNFYFIVMGGVEMAIYNIFLWMLQFQVFGNGDDVFKFIYIEVVIGVVVCFQNRKCSCVLMLQYFIVVGIGRVEIDIGFGVANCWAIY